MLSEVLFGTWPTVLSLPTAAPFHLLKCWNFWPILVSFLPVSLFPFHTLFSFICSGVQQHFFRSFLEIAHGTGFHSIHSLLTHQKQLKMFSVSQIIALATALSSASAACVPRGSSGSGSETTPTSAAPTTTSSLVASNLPVQAVSTSASSAAPTSSAAAASSSSSASSDGTKYFAVLSVNTCPCKPDLDF